MPSFGEQVPDMRRVGPITNIHIAVGIVTENTLRESGTPIPPPIPAVAVIDTDASISVIRQGIGAQLGLQPLV